MIRQKKVKKYNVTDEINSILRSALPVKRPTKKQMGWKQAKKKYPNLDPLGNVDGDIMPNMIDCKPFDITKQDFTPFRKRPGLKEEYEMTAAERFGPKNIKRLPKIGEGRDRKVYALDNDKVLKVAKNIGGLRQNEPESDLGGFLGYLKHYETGKDYVVMEKADKPGRKTKELIKKIKKARDNPDNPKRHQNLMHIARVLENEGHDDLINYEFSDDISRKSSWGEKGGEPVLIDAGTLLDRKTISKEHNPQKLIEARNKLINEKIKRENLIREIQENKAVGGDEQRKEEVIRDNIYRLNNTKNKIRMINNELDEWNEIKTDRSKYRKKGEKNEELREKRKMYRNTEEKQTLPPIADDWDGDGTPNSQDENPLNPVTDKIYGWHTTDQDDTAMHNKYGGSIKFGTEPTKDYEEEQENIDKEDYEETETAEETAEETENETEQEKEV